MTVNPEKKIPLILTLLILALAACDPNRTYEEHIAIDKGVWIASNKLEFTVLVSDTQSPYNVYMTIRNSPDYSYSNLYLFLTTVFPDQHIARDTVELTLADYDGRWLGSGMGSVKFSRFLFKQGVRFPQTGNYRFIVEQAMRTKELAGILDFGFRIEKHMPDQ
jgi:gliding motility-associated lipoprotein GldH